MCLQKPHLLMFLPADWFSGQPERGGIALSYIRNPA